MPQPLKKPIHKLTRNQYPVKILQFGGGNFLRGFADWMVHVANEKTGFNAGIAVVQDSTNTNLLLQQEGVYTVILKGIREEEFINQQYKIDIIQRVINPESNFEAFLEEALNADLQFIISSAAEPALDFNEKDTSAANVASTFPGKLTQLLYHRFEHQLDNGLMVLPTEPHEQNGTTLKAHIQKYCIHWKLPADFMAWLNMRVTFCNTLVDRIVSGFPKKSRESVFAELGYADELVVEGELFHLWVIEGPRWMDEVLPLRKAGLNVIYTDDLTPYHLRRVRILNGAETCMAFIGSLAGLLSVRETIEHPVVGRYIKRMIYDDIVPLVPGDLSDLEKYAEEAIDRFRNPATDHPLSSISEDGFSKFCLHVLPTLMAQVENNGMVHDRLAYALAALISFYRHNDGNEEKVAFIQHAWKDADRSKKGMLECCRKVLNHQEEWGVSLSTVPNLVERTGAYLYAIDQSGVIESLNDL